MNSLINAINDLHEASYESTGTVYKSDVIDLINEAMEGKVICPVEPDEEMITNGRNTYMEHKRRPAFNGSYDATVAMYKAMISGVE